MVLGEGELGDGSVEGWPGVGGLNHDGQPSVQHMTHKAGAHVLEGRDCRGSLPRPQKNPLHTTF